MSGPTPIKPFNGEPADSLQGTDISPAQAYMMADLDNLYGKQEFVNDIKALISSQQKRDADFHKNLSDKETIE